MNKVTIVHQGIPELSRLAMTLRSSGITVRSEACLVGALESTILDAPDLIVCWENLQGLDAADFLEIRSQDAKLREIPVQVVGADDSSKLNCFRHGCEDFVLLPVEDAELSYRVANLLRRKQTPELCGILSEIALVDVVQMLVSARAEGELVIYSGGASGKLLFSKGQVVHAEFAASEGEQAFLLLLKATRSRGRFAFNTQDIAPGSQTITRRTDHILLSFASLLDEGGV